MNLLHLLLLQGTKKMSYEFNTITPGIWADVCEDHIAIVTPNNKIEVTNILTGRVDSYNPIPGDRPQYIRVEYFDNKIFLMYSDGKTEQTAKLYYPYKKIFLPISYCFGVNPVEIQKLNDILYAFIMISNSLMYQYDWRNGIWDFLATIQIPPTSQGLWNGTILTDINRESIPGFLHPTVIDGNIIGQNPEPDFMKLRTEFGEEYNLFSELCQEPRFVKNSDGSYSICARLLHERILFIQGYPPFNGTLLTDEPKEEEMKSPKIKVLEYATDLKKNQDNTLVRYRDTENNQVVIIELQKDGNLRVSHQIDGVGFDRTGVKRIVKW